MEQMITGSSANFFLSSSMSSFGMGRDGLFLELGERSRGRKIRMTGQIWTHFSAFDGFVEMSQQNGVVRQESGGVRLLCCGQRDS